MPEQERLLFADADMLFLDGGNWKTSVWSKMPVTLQGVLWSRPVARVDDNFDCFDTKNIVFTNPKLDVCLAYDKHDPVKVW